MQGPKVGAFSECSRQNEGPIWLDWIEPEGRRVGGEVRSEEETWSYGDCRSLSGLCHFPDDMGAVGGF